MKRTTPILHITGNAQYLFRKAGAKESTFHTANLLVNALVKDIQECADSTVKILYGDTDSKPIYLSFSAFETKEEEDKIPQHDEVYINALTSSAYINQFYSERK